MAHEVVGGRGSAGSRKRWLSFRRCYTSENTAHPRTLVQLGREQYIILALLMAQVSDRPGLGPIFFFLRRSRLFSAQKGKPVLGSLVDRRI
jgi:hypothetical protein